MPCRNSASTSACTMRTAEAGVSADSPTRAHRCMPPVCRCAPSVPNGINREAVLSLGLVERHGLPDERLQRVLVDRVVFADVDGATDLSLQTGVEQAGRVV